MGRGGVWISSKRRRFDRELKLEAVRLAQTSGQRGNQVARDPGVLPTCSVVGWEKELEEDAEKAFSGEGRTRIAELARLRREAAVLATEERDILEEAVVIFSEPRR